MLLHAVNWFEIPVSDFARAKKFYSEIFAYDMPEMEMGPVRMGILPHDRQGGGIGGAICAGEGYTPSDRGPKIYLNGGSDLTTVLDRVEAAGGKVLLQKTEISPESGHFALFRDSEGNHLGLHSMA
ncbi:VOC family protein [Neolewinella litorea]|uniref:VOC family protein n=2 Tax=Neolewinella litorea TaxID=2562452 RepID=A0A4S4P0L3_9BACT|nr:VOC family protein [Neolewinella litorea]